jgi:hypothetical protein
LVAGSGNTCSGQYSFTTGNTNTLTGANGFMFGSYCYSDKDYTGTLGFGTKNRTAGMFAFAGQNSYASSGSSAYDYNQTELWNSSVKTYDATPTNLYNYGSAPPANASYGYLIQSAKSARAFQIMVVALTETGSDAAYWKVEGLIKTGTSSTSMAFVGTPTITQVAATAGASTWSLGWKSWTYATDGWGLEATGAASTAIAWQATWIMAQVGF